MTLQTRVAGGTNAGSKKPFNGKALEWQCDCLVPDGPGTQKLKTNPGYRTRCPECRRRRP